MSPVRGPWDPAEIAWAHNRPRQHQTPIPHPGDKVLFRMDPHAAPTDATVLEVQDPDARDDPHMWHVVRNDAGGALLDELGRMVMKPAPDQWPVLTLQTVYGRLTCREGRVRGAPGWLPLDWQRRWYPAPGGGRLVRDIDGSPR